MWIRLTGVLFLIAVGIVFTIGTATSAPGDAPLEQLSATQTAAALTAMATPPTAITPSATVAPSNTPIPSATGIVTLTPQTGLVDLQIFKSASAGVVATGDQLTYSITITNSSFAGASSPATLLTDTLPTGVVFISASGGNGCTNSSAQFTGGGIVTCNVPSLGPNQSMVFTILVQVTAGTGTTLTNTAQIDPNNAVVETNEGNNFATVTTSVGVTAVPTLTTGPAAPTATPTSVSGPPITVAETPVPPTAVPAAGTLWVQILAPTQVYSVTDDLLWTAQPGELYWVELEQPGWLLVVWEGDSKAWSVWIADDGRVQRMTLNRPAPPDAGDLWLVAFGSVQSYFEDMSPAWSTSAGEWYFVIARDAGWALVRYETDPPNIVVWIQEQPGVEYTFFDAPHQPG